MMRLLYYNCCYRGQVVYDYRLGDNSFFKIVQMLEGLLVMEAIVILWILLVLVISDWLMNDTLYSVMTDNAVKTSHAYHYSSVIYEAEN
jgi:hypothetical protein